MPKNISSRHRSAKTGRFVTKAAAKRWPTKTVKESVNKGGKRKVHRSAVTGRFITERQAQLNPNETISEKVR